MKVRPMKAVQIRNASEELGLASPRKYFNTVAQVLEKLPISSVDECVDQLFKAYLENRSVYVFGNGGSAALASHCACDLNKGTTIEGKRHFRVLSLTDNVPLITAWANDANYEDIFSAQLRPLVQANDIAMAISGSGNSPNVLSALRVARQVGAVTLGLGGYTGGKMAALCDVCVVAPSDNMQQIEDAHLCIMHALFLALANLIRNSSVTLRAKGAAAR
jgi:D-sedoheptulose 7-phosphate isomerase